MGNAAGVNLASSSLDLIDIETPRGESAKKEVRRLRAKMVENEATMLTLMATAKFRELDKDQSGYLENEELKEVCNWVIASLGKKQGTEDTDKFQQRMMRRLDANKDGKLDTNEFAVLFLEMSKRFALLERANKKFEEFDVDKSGHLESAELDQVVEWTMSAFSDSDPKSYKAKLIERIDTNKDGKLDRNEFMKLFDEYLTRIELVNRAIYKFQEFDKDNSGFLEKTEIEEMVRQVLLVFSEKSDTEVEQFRVSLLKKVDVNNDKKISLQEFSDLFDEMLQRLDLIEQARKQFRNLDKDGSGTLERPELEEVLGLWSTAVAQATGVECKASLDELVAKMDKNGDGKIDLLEFVSLFEVVTSELAVWG